MTNIGIVTDYAGARFRSRLEARWAAFFDLCGWRWEYEPPEEAGWIPDFLLIGKVAVIKVEIKPIAWVGDEDAMIKQANARDDLEKIHRYATAYLKSIPNKYAPEYALGAGREELLLLGAYPHIYEPHFALGALGLFWLDSWNQEICTAPLIMRAPSTSPLPAVIK